MRKKKVYHLKKSFKIILVLIPLLGILGVFGYQKYQDYLYTQTKEYALLELGYNENQTTTLIEKLSEGELEHILIYGYNEFIPEFVKAKYFLIKNLDKYLSQVITKDQDFFKYQGTDGYDYDNIVALVNTRATDEFYSEPTKTDISLEYSMLVNKYHELGSDYEPDDLVDINIKYYYGGPKKIRAAVYDAFIAMWESAQKEDIYLIVDSAYRDYQSQADVYKYYEDYKGTKYADSIAARPGYSEHQTGLALDIYAKECLSAKTFKDSKAYAWLIANAHKFGFILRYPKDKEKITGYAYESWHYRYLGEDLATKVYDSGLTYDEYVAYYLEWF